MHGLIFTSFSDMVVNDYGMSYWNHLIESTKPSSGGAYTNGAQYDDSEIISYVNKISVEKDINREDLTRKFGEYLAPHLLENSPTEISVEVGFKDFIINIDDVIHAEVRRLHPESYLPSIECRVKGNDIAMHYRSKRNLCFLAEGLILGSAQYFSEEVKVSQTQCSLKGAEHCILNITIT